MSHNFPPPSLKSLLLHVRTLAKPILRRLKACSYVRALGRAFGLVSPNQVHGEAGCIVVEVMDQQAAPQREPVDQPASTEREPTSSVHPRGKIKPIKNAKSPQALRSLTKQGSRLLCRGKA